ncbi:MAG: hypothetical protein II388_02700 [Clostridia bacterium]|nr:hypothetical protein [Clostridia bacterium]
MYKRKTYDEYEIETNYGYGWEVELTESTMKEAKQRKREYMENARGLIGIRIKHRRIPIAKAKM